LKHSLLPYPLKSPAVMEDLRTVEMASRKVETLRKLAKITP